MVALIGAVVLGAAAASLVATVTSTNRQHASVHGEFLRLNIAEAGVGRALIDLRAGGTGNLGSAVFPVAFGAGEFWTTTVDNGDQTFTVTAYGNLQGRTTAVEAVLRRTGGVFANAVFAGNSSQDPNYVMGFGGFGQQADQIVGDLFSGGSISIAGDATVKGDLRATGSIQGAKGQTGVKQPVPDIDGADYENNHDVNVAADFAKSAKYQSDNAGGKAWQVPEASPSHIFRLNPSDRAIEVASTEKNDYFLEDPYEPVRVDPNQNGKDAYKISPGAGVGKVYYIDGNLWIHNRKTYSFRFKHPQKNGIQVTFVVKGNIYISDNIFYQNKNKDGVAFIAIQDDSVEDSGNIYFGDPAFGTLERMESFLYAENNFYDNNLDAAGSATVDVYGIMSAGNHVAINRDWGNQHSRLGVTFDSRVRDGVLDLPGLPDQSGNLDYTIVSWRYVTAGVAP